MKILRLITILILLFPTFSLAAELQESQCSKVTIGGLDWDSSRFHVAVAKYVLENGYGCKVDVIPGTTMPLLTALGRGDIDILMEIWKDNITEAWNKLEKEDKVIDAGVNFPDAVQGFYVPTYLIHGDKKRNIPARAPDLKSVQDLVKYKSLFRDPEEPSKARFLNCPLGWSCEDVNTKKLFAYGLLKDFINFRPGTGAALAAAIKSNFEQGTPFVAYYWGPTWILGKYELTKLEEPPYNKKIWDKLVESKFPRQATAYPMVEVHIGVNKKFSTKNKVVMGFLSSYSTTSKDISNALAYMEEKKERTPQDAAVEFLQNNENIWASWVSATAFTRIKESLSDKSSQEVEWKLNIRPIINNFVNSVVRNYGQTFRSSGRPILTLLRWSDSILRAVHWWVLILIIGLLSLLTREKRLPIITMGCLLLIKALGMWALSLQTLSIMLISTFISIVVGLPLGILSSHYPRVRRILMPLLDGMQTMPSFVYLIPALMLFGLGKVPAVFATVIYAIAPTIRLTDLGLRQVDSAIIESARAFGASQIQILMYVRMPLALKTIMAGLNQTTMLALSMVVIAAMIGARGLGEQVLLGIQKLDVGQGFTAGLAIVLLAVVLDRLTQAFGRSLDKVRS